MIKRDKKNGLLGGVCAGMGKSLGIPTLLVRLGFIFGTLWLGGGVLVYLLLWILLPVEDAAILENFKLERDEKNGLLGGVCAGIAESSGVNVTLIRLLWVFAVLYFGFGLIPYIILWILMPKKAE